MEKTIVVMECLMPEFLTGLGQLWADNQVMGMIASVLVTMMMMMMMMMIKLVYVGISNHRLSVSISPIDDIDKTVQILQIAVFDTNSFVNESHDT